MQAKEWHVLRAVIAAGIMSFSGVLIETSMNVTFPTLMNEFQTDANGVQWVTTGYLLAIAVIVPLSAFLIRNYSPRRLFIIANLLFLVGVILDGFAPNLLALLTGRVFQGIGTGIALPLMFDIILTKSPLDRRGVMMGIGTMTTSIAPAIGPTYGGILLNSLGWRSIFWFLIVLLVASLIMGLTSMPVETVKRTESFAFGAFVFLGLGLALLLMAVERLSLMFLIGAVVLLVIFAFLNKRRQLLNLAILRHSRYDRLMISFLVYQAILLGLSFILPNYLQLGLGRTATAAGLFMFPGAVIGSVLAPVSGRVLDKFGAVKPILFGLSVATLAMVLMAVFFKELSFWTLMLTHMLLMVGIGFSYANLMTITLSSLAPSENADGNSVLNTLQQFVGASATAIVAQIFSSATDRHIGDGVVTGSQSGVIFLTVLMIVSILAFFTVMCSVKTANK
ncbi:MFS transporter [Weissella confusa]|uniref:MFS transporter n=1 Tax=Weissella confusa TaxID=1583 RepID=UPI0018F13E99|nr:MFS transporter [Weissella confusa]MBJ7618850.1 multidrug efflux MFS transporter [Weissella confusa]MBJ7624119.1 multidrug efflux MFS transporter [Weissella confusa]MBJ7657428.1 multidrug efflux MFS transporter [Weissella confusa]MBJ7665449.1 multidrug efflux MFS transporter [Weissella confusa]MBJ7675679.1 multidrug efflux MFS transporter [Weissella confusa]